MCIQESGLFRLPISSFLVRSRVFPFQSLCTSVISFLDILLFFSFLCFLSSPLRSSLLRNQFLFLKAYILKKSSK